VIAAAPPPPPPPPAKPTEPDYPPLTLVGTAVGKAMSVGIFTEQGTKNIVHLRIGEAQGGWTLRAIKVREAVFEKDRRDVILALPARDGAVQTAASAPEPNPAAASESASAGVPVAPATSMAAQQASLNEDQSAANNKQPAAPAAAWLDGDGQPMTPPPKPQTAADGKPLGPAIWLDGYGRPIGPAPSTWTDGDGQSISPPPYPWLDAQGNALVPPAQAWRDGDGRFISPPLTRTTQSSAH
jgi:hypothetical protein